MEKTYILCPQCGQRLAQLLGEIGQRRRLEAIGGARVQIAKNALGEDVGWIRCAKCKTDKSINPATWFGEP
jgi:hypothetical protein